MLSLGRFLPLWLFPCNKTLFIRTLDSILGNSVLVGLIVAGLAILFVKTTCLHL